jgi:hypothetical protein
MEDMRNCMEGYRRKWERKEGMGEDVVKRIEEERTKCRKKEAKQRRSFRMEGCKKKCATN